MQLELILHAIVDQVDPLSRGSAIPQVADPRDSGSKPICLDFCDQRQKLTILPTGSSNMGIVSVPRPV